MPARIFKSTVVPKVLSTDMNSSVATMTLTNTSTVPLTYPFTMVIDPDTISEEIVTVTTAPSGSTYPITRGQDGTSATTHLAGSTVKHMVTARDLQEPQDHIYASANVHGLATAGPGSTSGGSVVGTTASQALTNKAISASSISGTITSTGTISGGTISGATLTTPVIASIKNAAGNVYITDTDLNFTVGSNDSIINKSYFYQLGASRGLANTTSTQSIFGKSITLPETGPANTLYHVDAKIKLNTGTATHSVNFQLNGTATALPLCDLFVTASDSTGTPVFNTLVGITQVTSSASTVNVIVNGLNTAFLLITGTFAAPTGTVLDPSIKFTAAPGGTNEVATSSYIKITPIGPWVTATNTVRGSWA